MAGRIGAGLAGRRRVKTPRDRVLEPWPLRHSLVVFLVGAGAALGVFVFVYGATDAEPTRDRVDVAIKAAAAVAAVAAGLLTWGRLELSRHEHRLGVDRDLTERYGRAVEQLASTDELVRVGGVFAMERFALDAVHADPASDVDWRMALGLLAALARQDSAWSVLARRGADDGNQDVDPPAPQTVREAVQAIGRFTARTGRQLTGGMPDLREVIAPGADLRGANLRGAKLSGADLRGANLRDVDLTNGQLGGADLRLADLTSTNLTTADLTGADLRLAKLSGADLRGANLRDVDLTSCRLGGADLRLADLTGTNLTSADLTGAELSRVDLTDVRYDRITLWPEGFEPPPSA